MLIAALSAQGTASAKPLDLSEGQVVYVDAEDGRCIYYVTDGGWGAKELAANLRYFDKAARIEFLTNPDTPARCVNIAIKSVKKVGFLNYRVRPATVNDPSTFPPVRE